jgi:hypothetical protein
MFYKGILKTVQLPSFFFAYHASRREYRATTSWNSFHWKLYILGLVRFYPNPYGLRGIEGFQSPVSQNPLQSISIPFDPYGLKITEQGLRGCVWEQSFSAVL